MLTPRDKSCVVAERSSIFPVDVKRETVDVLFLLPLTNKSKRKLAINRSA
jgi:hypothetical protein